jgi:ABC-type uncharacterized transport system auxiliary subunit
MRFLLQANWRVISLGLVFVLTACAPSLQSQAPARDIYLLRPSVSQVAPERLLTLQILPVRVRPGYASDAILRLGPERTLDIFAASRWPDVLPRVVEGLLVDGLNAAGLGRVLEPLSSGRADGLVQVVVRRFEADYSSGARLPQVHVIWDVTVLDRARREVAVSFTAESVVPVAENRLGSIIGAFEEATANVLSQSAERLAEPAWRSGIMREPTP